MHPLGRVELVDVRLTANAVASVCRAWRYGESGATFACKSRNVKITGGNFYIGEHKKAVETARALLACGDMPEKIAAVTGLSLAEIEQLQNDTAK